jgi:hypothetical protein
MSRNAMTGTVLVAVSAIALCRWSVAWRRQLRADGVLSPRFASLSRREADTEAAALEPAVLAPAVSEPAVSETWSACGNGLAFAGNGEESW